MQLCKDPCNCYCLLAGVARCPVESLPESVEDSTVQYTTDVAVLQASCSLQHMGLQPSAYGPHAAHQVVLCSPQPHL
jgi:hypothetical protein